MTESLEEIAEIQLNLKALDEADPTFPLRGAVASFLFMVMPIDGHTHPKEVERLTRILADDFNLEGQAASDLITYAENRKLSNEAMHQTAEILKAGFTKRELLTLVSHMWEMVFADGRLHEMEVLLVERVASLLDVSADEVKRSMTL